MKTKILFLDIDGVLNLIPQGFDEFGGIFHPHFVENLRELIDKTGAKIVITSTWRFSGLKTMQEMWKKRNLPGEVIDITPDEQDLVKLKLFKYYDEVCRGHEIQYWLDKHPEVTNYCILDDDNDMLDSQLDNFVRTSGNHNHTDYVDDGYGLTKECTQEAIRILNCSNRSDT